MTTAVLCIYLAFFAGWIMATAFIHINQRLSESPETRHARKKKDEERACQKGKHPVDDKRYVALEDVESYFCSWHQRWSYRYCCSFCGHRADLQIARWECTACGVQGITEKDKRYGRWKIHHGKLVPDSKGWANTEEK